MNSRNNSTNPVFILGMHRSGTSALAGMLEQYGLFLGDVTETSGFNPKGNREHKKVRRIDDRLLHVNGGSWFRPVEAVQIPGDIKTAISRFRGGMDAHVNPWGVKDPRLLYCLKAWIKPGDRLVGIFRHPASVVQSLGHRNKHSSRPLGFSRWEELWWSYNKKLVSLYRRQPFPIVNFDWEPDRFCRAVTAVASHLGLPGISEDFFDPSLVHHRTYRSIEDEATVALYDELRAIGALEETKRTGASAPVRQTKS